MNKKWEDEALAVWVNLSPPASVHAHDFVDAYIAGRKAQVEADAKLLEERAAKSRDMESKVLACDDEEHTWNMIAKYEQFAADAIRAQLEEGV